MGYKDELYVRFLIICVQIKKAVERYQFEQFAYG